jgi:predicted dehydrogenase
MLGTNKDLFNRWGDYDRKKFTVEDFAVGFIRFENGAVVSLESSFMGNMEDDPFETQLFGTKSGARVRPFEAEPLHIYTEVDRQLFDMKPKNLPTKDFPYLAEAEAFVDSVRNDRPSQVPGEQGLILNAIFDAMYLSSEKGAEVKIDVTV